MPNERINAETLFWSGIDLEFQEIGRGHFEAECTIMFNYVQFCTDFSIGYLNNIYKNFQFDSDM